MNRVHLRNVLTFTDYYLLPIIIYYLLTPGDAFARSVTGANRYNAL